MSYIFATLVFIGTTIVFGSEVVLNNSNILLALFIPGSLLTRSVITGLVLYLADSEVLAEDFYGGETD